MLIPFEEEIVLDIHPTTNEQKDDLDKTEIKVEVKKRCKICSKISRRKRCFRLKNYGIYGN